jgi:DNA polymerase III subunit alpha
MAVKPTQMRIESAQENYLLYMVEKGLYERYDNYGPDTLDQVLVPRIKEELRVITNAGFTNYFLIVGDFMQWCRNNGIPLGPARGSAGGSVVAYVLGITDVDPIFHDLIFERFLNDERLAMPDIDMDLCWHRRQEALEYLVNKYGEDQVAQIVTFGTLSAKALIDDLCRVFNISKQDAKSLKSLIPDGEKIKYIDLFENEDFIEELHRVGEKEPRLIPAMMKLEGLQRHGSVHAGGIIIADRPMTQLAPTYKPPKAKRSIVQYEMFDAEAVGLLKIDALGLRTVTQIDWAEKDVRRLYDPNFYTRGYRLDDQAAFDLINRGDCYGIFQLEGTGITRFAGEMIVESFNDIVALLALYRPGPLDSGMAQKYIDRKNGKEAVTYEHPDLEPILRDTFGIIVYQEQVMFILQKLAGFTLGQADVTRKAMGKKKKSLMDAELAKFTTGALARGYDPAVVEHMSEQIATFARYGFNKSHAVAYAYITYWTAVLKARYPVAFFAAWLNVTDKNEKKGWIMDQAARTGIGVLPPDVNESETMFTAVDDNTIRFGLSAVSGMGASFVAKTMANRNAKGPFESYWDFCLRVGSVPVDKKENLAKAGAFDFDTKTHRGFLVKYARPLSDMSKKKKGLTAEEAYALFEDTAMLKPLEMGELEKESVAFYITDDPIRGIQEELRMLGGSVGVEDEDLRGQPIVGGRITNVHEMTTRKGDKMAFIDVDDGIISHSVTLFPNVWKRVKPHMVKDTFTAMRCDISQYRGKPTLQAIAVFPIDMNNRDSDLVLDLGMEPSGMILAQTKMTLDSADEGSGSVRIRISNGKHWFTLKSDLYQIRITDDIIEKLKGILGAAAVSLDRRKHERK